MQQFELDGKVKNFEELSYLINEPCQEEAAKIKQEK